LDDARHMGEEKVEEYIMGVMKEPKPVVQTTPPQQPLRPSPAPQVQDATIRECLTILSKQVPSVAVFVQAEQSLTRMENMAQAVTVASNVAMLVAENAPNIKTVAAGVVTLTGVFSDAMKNLGPIAAGVGVALQVVGAVADRVILVKMNKEKCRLTYDRMNQSLPTFENLRKQALAVISDLLDSRHVTAAAIATAKDDFSVLSKPLQAVIAAMEDGKGIVELWTKMNKKQGDGKMKRMAKGVKRGVKAGDFKERFDDWGIQFDRALQSLQSAVSTRTLGKVSEMLQQARQAGGSTFRNNLDKAEAQDVRRLALDVEDLMVESREFREELGHDIADIKQDLQRNFKQLYAVLNKEFDSLHDRFDKMDSNFQKSHEKMDDIHEDLKKMGEQVEAAAASPATARKEVELIDFGELHVEDDGKSGEGSFGQVTMAYWNGKRVAVKVLKDDKLRKRDAKKLEDEAKAHCRVAHPNIVKCLGMCIPPNLCIVMEYVSPDLYNAFDDVEGDTLPHGQQWLLALQIAAGMRAVHRAGVQHRDLRSPNILLGPKGDRVCRITDFGMSKAKSMFSSMTKVDTSAITPHWLAPELMACGKYSNETDVFAYGTVLYEIAKLGEVPLADVGNDRKTIENVYSSGKHLAEADELAADIDDKFRELLKMCWDPLPSKRPSFEGIYNFITHHGKCDKMITF